MSMVPKAGCSGFATDLPLSVAGVLEKGGVTVDENIVNCLPSNDFVGTMITERAVDSIMLVLVSIRNNPYC